MYPKIVIALLLGFGVWHVSASGYMLAKAHLSQHLIDNAWQETLKDKQNHVPWSWADTYPIAKLNIPKLNKNTFILQGSSGRNLAFSATHLINSGMPGDSKTMVVSGHRDSHFNYLKELNYGDELTVETIDNSYTYVISKLSVVDSQKSKIRITNKRNLVLTTCYPFDSLTSGSLRFVIHAKLKH